jgi:hypothetical protein
MTCTLHPLRALRSAILLLCATLASARAAAQAPFNLTIAVAPRLADSTARAMIVRDAGPNGGTLIVLRDDAADAAMLATALTSLQRSRRKLGDLLAYQVVITLLGHRSTSSLTLDERRRADDYVSRLRNAPAVFVDGVGLAKTVTIPMPSLAPASGS